MVLRGDFEDRQKQPAREYRRNGEILRSPPLQGRWSTVKNAEILEKVRWNTVNIKRSCFKGGLFEGRQASFWQLLGEFSGVQLEDFATLRGGF